MPPNNPFGAISLDAFRAGIPTGDVTLRVEHKDRVILRAIDEQTKFFFTFAQFLFSFPAVSYVSKNQDDTGYFSVRIANRGRTIVDGYFCSVSGNEQGVVCQSKDQAFSQGSDARVLDSRARLLVDDLEDLI